jgi:uncharacterized protein (TIGR03435 family)
MRLTAFGKLAVLVWGFAASAPGQTFEAASVRLWTSDVKQPYTITGGPGTSEPGRFRAPRVSMSTLLGLAFDVKNDQITGPAWLRDFSSANNYTIVATIAPGTTKEQFRTMLQNLLAERFHLVFHKETRDFPGYELVVDKGGAKFKEVATSQNAGSPAVTDPRAILEAPAGDDGFPKLPGSRVISQMSRNGGPTRTKYQERTMAEFVSNLGYLIGASQGKSVLDGHLQPRVVDKTGLTGKYTFILEYYDGAAAQLGRMFPSGAAPDAGNAASPAATDPGGGPTIFSAIQKQLGLRLDKVAAVPLEMIVVDSVDKVPTEN